jgi:hypothetical protein
LSYTHHRWRVTAWSELSDKKVDIHPPLSSCQGTFEKETSQQTLVLPHQLV